MTVVREDAIPESCYTSKTLTVKGFGPGIRRCRTARVELQIGDCHEQLEVIAAPLDYLSNIALLGKDIPFFGGPMYVKSIDVVNLQESNCDLEKQLE